MAVWAWPQLPSVASPWVWSRRDDPAVICLENAKQSDSVIKKGTARVR